MNLIKLSFLSLLAMVLTACGGEDSGLPSQGGGDGGTVPTIVSLQVTPATATVPVGLGQQYLAEALLNDGTVIDVTENPAVSWSSSDPAIATVNNKGLATGITPGDVIITASGSTNGVPFERKANLTISNAVITQLQITPTNATIPVGIEQQFTAIASLSDGKKLDVTTQPALNWTTSEATIATIANDPEIKGKAKGVAPGNVTITASGTVNSALLSATAQLDVTNAVVTQLQITPTTASIPVGLEQPFTAIATFSDGHTLNVTTQSALNWSSSNPNIATIENNRAKKGHATGITPGEVTITASGTTNDTLFEATAQLEVTSAIVRELEVTPETASVPVGVTRQYIANAILSDGSTLDVTNQAALSWNTRNSQIATISNNSLDKGLAKGVSPGTTTVTATGSAHGSQFSDSVDVSVLALQDLRVTLFSTIENTLVDGGENEVEATVTDENGAPIEGVNVTFSSNTPQASIMNENAVTDINGKAKTKVTTLTQSNVSITAALLDADDLAAVHTTITTHFSLLEYAGSFIVNDSPADGITQNIYEVKLFSHDGIPAVGKLVTFSTTDPMLQLSTTSELTDQNGAARVLMTSTVNGTYPLTVEMQSCCTLYGLWVKFQ